MRSKPISKINPGQLRVEMIFGCLELWYPCEPPSDKAKTGEVKRALSERAARVAQRPVWLRNAGDPEL